MNDKILQSIERIFLQEGITIDDIVRYFGKKDRHKPDKDTSNERSCGTCVYAYCAGTDYPCRLCQPHTLNKWVELVPLNGTALYPQWGPQKFVKGDDNLTGREYLEEIRSIDMRLRSDERRVAKLQQDMCSLQAIDYSKTRVDGGVPVNIDDKLARIDEIIQKINREWAMLLDKREQAVGLIRQLDNLRYQDVLIERYVNNKKWEQVATDLKLSWKAIFNIHKRAIKDFEKKYTEVH